MSAGACEPFATSSGFFSALDGLEVSEAAAAISSQAWPSTD
jgi:hypothetical protein